MAHIWRERVVSILGKLLDKNMLYSRIKTNKNNNNMPAMLRHF